jgi:hypothetical protein
MKINVNPNFATIVTGHGKARTYFHRLKIMEQATCLCNNGDQTIDHLLYQCTLLYSPRELLQDDSFGTRPKKMRISQRIFIIQFNIL